MRIDKVYRFFLSICRSCTQAPLSTRQSPYSPTCTNTSLIIYSIARPLASWQFAKTNNCTAATKDNPVGVASSIQSRQPSKSCMARKWAHRVGKSSLRPCLRVTREIHSRQQEMRRKMTSSTDIHLPSEYAYFMLYVCRQCQDDVAWATNGGMLRTLELPCLRQQHATARRNICLSVF